MMGEFKQELRDGFIEACLHLVNRDFDSLAKDFVTLGYCINSAFHQLPNKLFSLMLTFYLACFVNKTFRLLPPTANKEAVTKALTGFSSNLHEPTYSYATF